MCDRVAILLDGGFAKKKLTQTLHRFPRPVDVVDLCQRIMASPRLTESRLLRIYFYDAPPYEGRSSNPMSGEVLDFSGTVEAKRNRALLDALEMQADFAVRRGTILHVGWKLGSAALRNLSRNPRAITASDFVPNMVQKGVDLRMGLDISAMALKRIVETLVLVSGDSDLVPAMKTARREGLRVYLETLGHHVRPELKVHADLVL